MQWHYNRITEFLWRDTMGKRFSGLATILALLLMAFASSAWGWQSSGQQQKPDQSKQSSGQSQAPQQTPPAQTQSNNAPAPLFEGKSTLKSSRQGKETATAGFNGVGPDGSVQASVLNANPSPADAQHVAAMASTTTDPAEVAAFAKEGKLNGPKGGQ
jgi:hypothetical protein